MSRLFGRNGASECPRDEMACFSDDYFEARDKFLCAAKEAGAEIQSYVVCRDEVRGVDLTMDVAIVHGSREAVLVHSSGLHGAEGFAGSAVQIMLLRKFAAERSRSEDDHKVARPTVIFVHAVNPYGFANNRRFNENNVDLNRNFLLDEQWKEVLGRDPNIAGYASFSSLMNPGAPNRLSSLFIYIKAIFLLARYGLVKLKKAMVTGQSHLPSGLYFVGREREKSVEVFKTIVSPFAPKLKYAVGIDVHTGLGPCGVDTLIVDTPTCPIAKQVFSGALVMDSTASSGAASGYDLAVGFLTDFPLYGSARAVTVCQEFGTINAVFVAAAMILENAAYHHARNSKIHKYYGKRLRDAFYVNTPTWKHSILQRGIKVYEQGYLHLLAQMNGV